ncbi:RIP metalloprotease RseP [Legionella londiniensis]|uniref:Zinc metalloprotease n=1 Tax=Legionella londiniensis TaxID=45068 RepID=A0A0W0VMF3_9GAMM|nr:RIP metalloprotease RseP [Legionella londiniensis]KTD21328.1 membrane associated zinc metalloprotease [Legionella londiniensis]STX93616.1 membrane associated zinc metalloprotease [Legionella londiniensis]
MLLTLVYFVLALLLLITIHEFGHFIVARLCNVKVLRFSFGFGKVLASFRDKHGTEFAWSAFPLGGYVKMLDESEGEVPAEERHLAFNNKSVWARIAIVAAGPLFNLLFAFFALWLVMVIGIKSLAPMIDAVKPGSIAAQAGLKPQQEILSINDEPVTSWRDFQYALISYLGSKESVSLTVKSLTSNEKTTVTLSLKNWQLQEKKPDLLSSLGITPFIPKVLPVIGQVKKDTPAFQAGLLSGDKILAVNDKTISDWFELVDVVKKKPDEVLLFTIERQGIQKKIAVKVEKTLVNGKEQGFLGVYSKKANWPDNWLRLHRLGPVEAIGAAFKQTAELTGTTFVLMARLAAGKLPLHSISGPVGIAQGAGESGRSGLPYYLFFLALVSVSLGVLNLLPIPMLDGGHLLFCLFELISRRPVSESVKSAGVYVGFLLLIALTIIALTNDLARLAS